jgi:hypothetical protein
MGLISWRRRPLAEERSDPVLSMNDWVSLLTQFSFNGVQYTVPTTTQEELGEHYGLVARSAYKGSGVVYACILSRMQLFSEARMCFRELNQGRPGELSYTPQTYLEPLVEPWPGGTTGDLLARLELYNSLAGNAYVMRRPNGRLFVPRPDWVTIIGGVQGDEDATVWHPDAEVLGYAYKEGGPGSGIDPVIFVAGEVAHFAPNVDPEARFRGMSWLTPVYREIMADKAATEHKLKFFENAATPNLVVKLDVQDLNVFKKWMEEFNAEHAGASNAYKTMYLGAGADATVVGANLQQMDFKATQGAGETRIAAAAGTPPIVVGLSEGLESATYSNYAQARRRFADGTIRPLWRNAAGSLARIIRVPEGKELWYDDRDIMALQEDQQDAANIFQTDSSSYVALVNAGVEPETAKAAVAARDIELVTHTNLLSVQLQPPGTTEPATEPSTNGQVPAEPAVNGG